MSGKSENACIGAPSKETTALAKLLKVSVKKYFAPQGNILFDLLVLQIGYFTALQYFWGMSFFSSGNKTSKQLESARFLQ